MRFSVYLDSNVLLDALLQRYPQFIECDQILKWAYRDLIKIYCSSSGLLTVIYFLKKSQIPHQKIIKIIDALLKYLFVIDSRKENFLEGLHSGFTDLEVAIQYYTALQIKGMDYFITSDKKHFRKALPQLPAVSPKKFCDIFNE